MIDDSATVHSAESTLKDYDRPSLTTDITAFTIRKEEEKNYRKLPVYHLSILMVRRSEDPYNGYWSLPGGFVTRNESVTEAAARILKRETGIEESYLALADIAGEQGRDPRGWVVSAAYWTLLEQNRLPAVPAAESGDPVQWFDVSYTRADHTVQTDANSCHSLDTWQLVLTSEEETLKATVRVRRESNLYNETVNCELISCDKIAFDHAVLIARSVFQLRHSVSDTPVAFKLLPEEFTLTELQKVYEVILDTPLLMANFRRKMAPYVLETDRFAPSGGYHPPKLFRRNLSAFMPSEMK